MTTFSNTAPPHPCPNHGIPSGPPAAATWLMMFLICWAWMMSGVSMTEVKLALSSSAVCLYLVCWAGGATGSRQEEHTSSDSRQRLLPLSVQKRKVVVQTWLRMSVAFLALMKSGVSVANANMPLPLISSSRDFLYSLCRHDKPHASTHTRTSTHTHTHTHGIRQGGGMLADKGVQVIWNVEGLQPRQN